MRSSILALVSTFSVACSNDMTDMHASSEVTKMFVGDVVDSVPPLPEQEITEETETQSVSEDVDLCDGNVVSPKGVELLIDLARPEEGEDIYMTYSRVEGIADIFEACTDPWGMFPTTYRHITARGIQGIEDGSFEDPTWAEDIIVDFAGRYMENLEAVLTRGEPSWAWQRYYELADRDDVSRTRSVLMAMNAHLLLDLPHSLAAIGTDEENKQDFFYFGDIMIEVADDLIVDLREIYGTDAEDILNGFFLGEWVDGAFGQETMITLSYQTIRSKSWNNRWYIQSGMAWVADAEIYTSFWALDAVLRGLDGAGIID